MDDHDPELTTQHQIWSASIEM